MKSMNLAKVLGSFVILAGINIPASQAAIIIDSFETDQNISLDNSATLKSFVSGVIAPDVVGGQRDVGFSQIERGTIGFPDFVPVTIANFNSVNPSMLTWTNELNWRSIINLIWDGSNALGGIDPNGLTLDLSSEDAFIFNSDFINLAGVTATLTVYSDVNESSLTINDLGVVADGNSTDFIFEFSDFTILAGDGVDFATDNIGAIQLVLEGNANNLEARFGELSTRSASTSVPEPSLSLLLLSGVTLLGGLSVKKGK